MNLVNSQPSVQESCTQQSSVIAQAMKQSGLDDEDVPDEDVDDEEVTIAQRIQNIAARNSCFYVSV